MEIFEITGYATGQTEEGVNYLQPGDSFQKIVNGYIYRQVLQSRQGMGYFAPRLADKSRIFGIFEHILPDGTSQLLAADKNFLYKYNTGTGVFDQIAFGGSLVAYGGFNISSKDFYISGTSYPTATNGARFVFTGEGIALNGTSAIFFYDGTNVKDFTNVGDNPNYAPYVGPLAINRANYVLWFNERLNFVVPTINSVTYNQGVLYSGIRTTSGNGDKFNVPGSGLLQLDTYETIRGVSILGQVIALNAERSNWTLDKTRDAFNPYFSRKVPSVLGTNANFSAVSWNDIVRSLGKTGIISTDGRKSLRADNKIPYYTANEIDQIDFNLTYGGFDRLNNQFLWSYKISESDSETQNAVLVNNYEEETWSTYDLRVSVFGQTDVGLNLAWDDIDETTGNESWATWDTTEEIWDRIGLGASVQKTLAGDDLGFIYELNQDYDDYYADISAITPGATTTLTVSESAFIAGDKVTISGVGGMTQLNNFDPSIVNENFEPYIVISATDTSVVIDVDSTTFSAYTTGGAITKVISFSAETIPFNPYRSQGRRIFVSHVEFLIDTNGGNLKVSVKSDEQQAPFIQDVLLLPTITNQDREWITMTVNNESNFMTFILKQESPATQLRLTSMRIHAAPGGYTSG